MRNDDAGGITVFAEYLLDAARELQPLRRQHIAAVYVQELLRANVRELSCLGNARHHLLYREMLVRIVVI